MITQTTVDQEQGRAAQLEMPVPGSAGKAMTIGQHLEKVALYDGHGFNPVTEGAWRVLTRMLFQKAPVDAILMALHYCQVRKLDIMKRCVNIVPMRVRDGDDWTDVWTIWPSIVEMRITAFRTKEYMGKDPMNWGPTFSPEFIDAARRFRGTDYPEVRTVVEDIFEWGEMTVYRGKDAKNRVPFVGPRVYWLEAHAKRAGWSNIPNSMWLERKVGQHEKCVEAATLRCAFPEETGGDYIDDEMEGRELLGDRLDQQHDLRRAAKLDNLPQAGGAPQSTAGGRAPPRPAEPEPKPATEPTAGAGSPHHLRPGEIVIDEATGEVIEERPLADTRPSTQTPSSRRPPRPDAPTVDAFRSTSQPDPLHDVSAATGSTTTQPSQGGDPELPWFLRVNALDKDRPDFKNAGITDILAFVWQVMNAAHNINEFEEIVEHHLNPLVDQIPQAGDQDMVRGSINKFAQRWAP